MDNFEEMLKELNVERKCVKLVSNFTPRKFENWRICTLNENYRICPSYPRYFYVPSAVSDTVILHASKYRTKHRFPILSYSYCNGACIARSSQPLSGLSRQRSVHDEHLVDAIRQCSPAKRLLIVDARPTANAVANTIKGAGVESMANYKGCERVFLSLGNIHVLQDCTDAIFREQSKGNNYQIVALNSGWSEQVMLLLTGTKVIVDAVVEGHSVLVHCSDGWDRTSQLTSLATITLSSSFRTAAGLENVFILEWLQAGHPFHKRYHCNGKLAVQRRDSLMEKLNSTMLGPKKTMAPVLPLFLDALYQIILTFPRHFSITEQDLHRLWCFVYENELGDCEAERETFCNETLFRDNNDFLKESLLDLSQVTYKKPLFSTFTFISTPED